MMRYSALAMILALSGASALAQESTPPEDGSVSAPETGSTDQSEEDWRRSQRRGDSKTYDPVSNPTSTGVGINIPEPREIDKLPEESRRHINRQRAKVIAEADLENLDPQSVAYEPSEAAKSDPGLLRDEQAAWAEAMGDLMGAGSGQGDGIDTGQGQANAPGGGQGAGSTPGGRQSGTRGSGSAGSTMAGGANQSAADILRQMQGLGGGGSTQGQPQGSGQAAGQTPSGEAGDGAGQTAAAGSGQASGAEQTDSNGASPGAEAAQGPATSGGSDATGASDGSAQQSSSGEGADSGGTDGNGDAANPATSNASGTPGGAGQSTSARDMVDAMNGAADSSEGAPGNEGDSSVEPSSSNASQAGSPSTDAERSSQSGSPGASAQTRPAPSTPPQARNLWLEVIERALGSGGSDPVELETSPVAETDAPSLEDLRKRILTGQPS